MQSFTGVFKKALFIMALCTVLIPSATHAAITKTVTAANEDPTVTIIAPNGGESFTEGQQITVRWSTVGIPTTQKVGFDLYTNQDTIKGYTLFNVSGQDLFDNDGQETLVIPSIRNSFTTWNYGNYFKIKMAVDNPDITAVDYSDSTFSISSVIAPMPSIHVISPNSGESYIAGQQIPVTWESANLPASSLVDIVVQHHYPGGNGIAGANYAQNLTPDGTSNDGTQVVTLPTQFPSRPFGRYFKILVIAHPYALTNTVYDVSDNLFTIQAPVSVANPAITVLSPNGGESYVAGQQIQVKWETANFSTQNNVFIGWWSSQTNQTSELLIATPNDGQETVILPTSSINGSPLPSGNYYKIYIALAGNPALSDKSDNTFTIQNGQIPTITVTSPNGGEVYDVGAPISMTWTSYNPQNLILQAQFDSVTNPGYSHLFIPDLRMTDDGSEIANIPVDLPPGKYKLRIGMIGANQNINDSSNESFTVKLPGQSICGINTNPSIRVLSPNGGESYLIDQQIPVQWSTCNIPSTEYFRIGLMQYDSNGTAVANVAVHTLATGNAMAQNSGSAIIYELPNTGGWGTYQPGNFYKISIQRCQNGGSSTGCSAAPASDLSDGLFAIQNSTNICAINYFGANPSTVVAGGMSGLNWTTTGCQNAMIANTGNAVLSPNGFLNVGPLTQTTTYTLYAGTLPAGCNSFAGYSNTTGQSCAAGAITATAIVTVSGSGIVLPAGCTSTSGYSTTSGQPCNLPEGCMAPTGFSTSTGQPCIANGGRPVRTPSVGPDPVAVKASFTRELKLGASGADVTALQNRLKTEGVYTSPITGYFGKMTQAALKKFQTKYGIPAVGAAGPRTLQVLNK